MKEFAESFTNTEEYSYLVIFIKNNIENLKQNVKKELKWRNIRKYVER
jgi:hypothetical protein